MARRSTVRRPRWWPSGLLAAGLLATGLLAGCGDDGDDGAADTTAGGQASDTTEASPAGESAEATITIADFSFGDPLTVSAGTEVTVENDDSATHTWTSVDGLFDERLDSGASTSFTFDEAGTFEFRCSIHPSMTGSVTVED